MGFFELLLILVIVIILVPLPACLAAFWIWMLMDCLKSETEEGGYRTKWMIILILGSFPGALVYFFVRRRKRLKEKAGQVARIRPQGRRPTSSPKG